MGVRTPVGTRRWDKASWLALAVILVAAFLRFYSLAGQPLWYDELAVISLANVEGGPLGIWSVRFYPHPPLFAILLGFLFKGFTPTEFSARLIPVFSGLAAFPLLYRYAADVAGKRTALVALLLLAVSPFHIFYCQDTRPYSLMFTLIVLTMWVLHKALTTNKASWWLAHALCLLLLLYLHFFGWGIVGGEVLYMLLCWRRTRRRLAPFALSLVVGLLALPPVYNLLRDSQTVGQVLVLNASPDSISFSATWMTLIGGETRYATQALRLTAVIAVGLLALVGCIRWAKHRLPLLVLMLSLVGVPFVFVFVVLPVVGHVVPPYEERQFMVVLPAALMLAAAGADHLWQVLRPRRARRMGGALAACLLAVPLVSNLITLNRYYTRFEKNLDIRVLDYLASRVEPGDAVICQGSSIAMNMDFYWERDVPVEIVAYPLHREGEWSFSQRLSIVPADSLRWDVSLDDVLSHSRVWLIAQDGFDSPEFAADMQGLASQVLVERFGPFSVYLFVP